MNFILFVFGLAIGSFINVVSLRFQPGQKLLVGGRSRCPYCQKQLNWYELIPVLSFIIQKGRCRSCHQKISFQYPIVEILSGLIFVFVPLRLKIFNPMIHDSGFMIHVLFWILIFLLFLLLSIIDFRHYIIPDSLNLSLGILGVILVVVKTLNPKPSTLRPNFMGYYSSLFTFSNKVWLNHLFGLVFAAFVFWLIIFLSKGKGMGWGDFKLACALGLIFGWPDILMVFILSFLLGGLSGIILIILKKKRLKEAVPFGPFLVLGAALTFFVGFQILNFYFKAFGF